MEQRSKEWFEMRKGRFTASRISELMGIKGLGKTGESYAFELACELVYGIDEEDNFVSHDIQRGISLEPLAFRKFSELKELEFKSVKEAYFMPYGENAGASPDGLIDDNGNLEIKCPRSGKFFKLVALGESEIDKNYLDQMQMQMLCSNSEYTSFFNYCIFNGIEMWHEIKINRDEKIIELIKSRIEEATELRNDYVKYLIENRQF